MWYGQHRRVLFSTFAQGFVEFLEQFALMLGQLDGRLERDVAIQVAWIGGADALGLDE